MLSSIKEYLNITTNDFDSFLESLKDQVVSEFRSLFKHNFRLLIKGTQTPYGTYARIKAIPTTISVVYGRDEINGNDVMIPSNEYQLTASTGFFYTSKIFQYFVIEGNRGYEENNLPKWLENKLVKLVVLEFKQSFKGDGLLVFSGRTVGEVSFNYAVNVKEDANEIKKSIHMFYYSPDEVEEAFI